MIELLRIVKEEFEKGPCKLRGREVVPRPQQKHLRKLMLCSSRSCQQGKEMKINVVYGKLQNSFFVHASLVTKYTPEGEGLANEGWDPRMEEIQGICSETLRYW